MAKKKSLSPSKSATGRVKRPGKSPRNNRIPFWEIMLRLLPVWALLIMILILEPTLPVRAVGAIFRWVGTPTETATQIPPVEPVYIVEELESLPPGQELPPPSWSLEVSSIFRPEVLHWQENIAEWSVQYRIKPNLIATLMQIESCGNPRAESDAGAVGLFQVLPLHFGALEDPLDPNTNAQKGLTFFAEMYAAANGDLGEAFAAYNGGPLLIGTSPAEWPEETQNYQFWATGVFQEAELGMDESPTLAEWLEVGGSSLCIQAGEVLKNLEGS